MYTGGSRVKLLVDCALVAAGFVGGGVVGGDGRVEGGSEDRGGAEARDLVREGTANGAANDLTDDDDAVLSAASLSANLTVRFLVFFGGGTTGMLKFSCDHLVAAANFASVSSSSPFRGCSSLCPVPMTSSFPSGNLSFLTIFINKFFECETRK